MKRTLVVATITAGLTSLLVGTLHAQTAGQAPAPEPPPSAPVAAPPAAMPPPQAAMPPPTAASPAPGAPVPDAVPAASTSQTLVRNQNDYNRPNDLSYGAAMRFRWVSVPAWMLNVFTKKNVPLGFRALPGAWAVEGFRRKGNFDAALSVGYQAMSPDDGNWLGTGKDANTETDFVQFRNLGFVNVDISFIWHTMFTDWIGMHYGAGLGIGFVTGKILRTSNYGIAGNDSAGCNDTNFGDLTKCKPKGVDCTPTSCNETQLNNTMGQKVDIPADPHRFSDSNVPSVIPIINAVVGVDFRVPSLRGWEAKIEGGFYDALFLGGGIAYTF